MVMVVVSLALASCNGGGSSSGGSNNGGNNNGGNNNGGNDGPVLQDFTSPNATADAFVQALNGLDATSSYVELYEDETFRSYEEGQEEWFVIWDDKFAEYKAVSLQYVRSIVYVDYVRNSDSLAGEFREIENDDIYMGEINGDYYGDDYEVVDYDQSSDSFWGRNSGFEYEDEAETTDVNLMAADAEQLKFYKKAAVISYEFNVSVSKAMSLVTLGTKVEGMRNSGDLSMEDLNVLSNDIKKVTGISATDLLSKSKEDVLKTAAEELGSTPAAIEQKLLPGLFGISL